MQTTELIPSMPDDQYSLILVPNTVEVPRPSELFHKATETLGKVPSCAPGAIGTRSKFRLGGTAIGQLAQTFRGLVKKDDLIFLDVGRITVTAACNIKDNAVYAREVSFHNDSLPYAAVRFCLPAGVFFAHFGGGALLDMEIDVETLRYKASNGRMNSAGRIFPQDEAEIGKVFSANVLALGAPNKVELNVGAADAVQQLTTCTEITRGRRVDGRPAAAVRDGEAESVGRNFAAKAIKGEGRGNYELPELGCQQVLSAMRRLAPTGTLITSTGHYVLGDAESYLALRRTPLPALEIKNIAAEASFLIDRSALKKTLDVFSVGLSADARMALSLLAKVDGGWVLEVATQHADACSCVYEHDIELTGELAHLEYRGLFIQRELRSVVDISTSDRLCIEVMRAGQSLILRVPTTDFVFLLVDAGQKDVPAPGSRNQPRRTKP